MTYVIAASVLGVPVRFESNDADLDAFIRLQFPDAAAHIPHVAAISIVQTTETSPSSLPAGRLLTPHLLALDGPGLQAFADARELRAGAICDRCAPPVLAALLDTLALFLVTSQDRTPLHAAALRCGDAAMLLAGPSGIGKSTLAYAAHAAGITIMTDDAVYIQRAPTLRVWALPRRVHVPTSSAVYFPELATVTPIQMPNGKVKLPVEIQRTGASARPAGICVLVRHGPDVPERISADDAATLLTSDIDPGFDRFADTLPDCIREIAQAGAWRLRVAGTPADVIDSLLPLLDSIN